MTTTVTVTTASHPVEVRLTRNYSFENGKTTQYTTTMLEPGAAVHSIHITEGDALSIQERAPQA